MKIPTFSLENMNTVLKFFRTVEDIERYVTNYQIIDLTPDGFMAQYDQDREFTVYLNNQVQFGRKDFKLYHETMVQGALNMVGQKPENILILGGGDGLILAELLKVSQIKTITQVELDPQMIALATFHPVMKELNQSIYVQDRVKLIYEDGFSYVRNTKEKYDAIFIDFPFPTSYDLSKLYSVEFYKALRKIMTTDGFFVFDAPIKISSSLGASFTEPSPQDIILSTLHAADFNNISAYGLTESFYVVSAGLVPLNLNYEMLPSWLTNQTIANLVVLNHALSSAKVSKNYVNSIFRPQKFIFK